MVHSNISRNSYLRNIHDPMILDLVHLILRVITEKENDHIITWPSKMELKEGLESIPIDSSPSPDGFGFGFFLTCWELVKEDLLEVGKEFFSGVPLPRFFTYSFIVLILKVVEPSSFENFRPISLCSVAYKIFSKIIVGQLSSYLNCIISPKQGAFLAGRSIF